MEARRYSKGKLRYELIPNAFLKELSKVYTIGAEKYTIRDEQGNITDDGANNWRKGLSWKKTLGAIYRHLQKFEDGEDLDYDYPPELLEEYGPTHHLANAAWGIATLLAYYKIFPQGDDRNHKWLNPPKIGLDIDEVIADWVGHWTRYHGQDIPETWNFDKDIHAKFEEMKDNKEFWLSIPPKVNPSDIPFEPHCYITSRSIPQAWTEEWIQRNGFPNVPVYTIPFNESKVDIAKQSGIDIFVDDRYENFAQLNKAGICCYLMDAPHNRRYNVGYRRIYSLKELS